MRKLSKKSFFKKKGFTLLELLVVVAIIGVLAGLIAVSIGGSRDRARDARRMSDFRQIPSAQEWIINDDNTYVQSPEIVGHIPASINNLGYQYLAQLTDPKNDADYKYVWVANNTSCGNVAAGKYYCAIAKLEEKRACATNEFRYFVAASGTAKEVCATADFVANPPDCAWCLAI